MSKRNPKVVIPAPEPVAPKMTSPIQKRSIVISGHKTSVSLEAKYWKLLHHIRDDRNGDLGEDAELTTLSSLVAEINEARLKNQQGNLSSAIRCHVLDWALTQADLLEVTTEMAHG